MGRRHGSVLALGEVLDGLPHVALADKGKEVTTRAEVWRAHENAVSPALLEAACGVLDRLVASGAFRGAQSVQLRLAAMDCLARWAHARVPLETKPYASIKGKRNAGAP